jgi:PPOX class probable F420-dependent enzyme
MIDQATEEYLRTHRQAVMATLRPDGRAHLTNVLTVYENGELLISLTETRVKTKNLLRDPRTTLLVLGDSFWQYLTIEGRVRFTRGEEAIPELRHYYEAASGPHPNWEEYDEAMRREQRVMAHVAIERVYGQGVAG